MVSAVNNLDIGAGPIKLDSDTDVILFCVS